MITLYDTLAHSAREFKPLDDGKVRLYTCGPTVYHFAHIGNLRTYIFSDLLRRVLEYNGLDITHGMNITDVGHLVSDGDEGEDKMELGAKREGKHPLEIAKHYEEAFFADIEALNIETPTTIIRATETITEQIEIIKLLEEKGFTYQDESAIYFDTSKLSDYGKLSGQKLEDKKVGAREDVVVDSNKKNPQDFVLWFFLTGRYADHVLQWPSPWGAGFPGWHIECSAISRKMLGQPFDIHTGGVDHIGTHHTNEIAQSEAAFDLPLANYWLHSEFLLIDEGRMGKSQGNAYTLSTITEKGFTALEYRYLCLTAQWRSQMNFTWESLAAVRPALQRLQTFAASEAPAATGIESYETRFREAVNDDLNIPKALGITWEMIKDSKYDTSAKIASLLKFDKVFGLKLGEKVATDSVEIPEVVKSLIEKRDEAKKNKDFSSSDSLRDQIKELGFEVRDTSEGQVLTKI